MCLGCMHPYPAGHWFYSLQDFTPLLENPLFYVFFFFFRGYGRCNYIKSD